MIIGVMFIALVAMICLNMPIAIALAISAVIGLFATEGVDSLVTVAIDMYDGATKFSLIAIPMFVVAGAIMNAGGIARRLIAFVSALLGFIRGGLAMVNVGVSLFFAEISGSAVADVAALGSILIPAMKKKGYSAPFSAAVTSSAASLAIIIPPSIPMILYAVSAETSVEKLFVAGFVPGLLGGLGLMAVAYYFARRYNFPVEEAFSVGRLKDTFIDALPTFALPVIILGGIFGGFVTATEAAGLAVVASLVIGLYYRELNFKRLREAMLDGGMQTAVVMLLVAASVLMGGFLTRAQMPQELAQSILELTDNQYVILLILNVFFLIIGFFLHSAAAIILVVPIIVPLIQQVGIDPIHFGLVVTLNLGIGQQTPPVASVLLTVCSTTGLKIEEAMIYGKWFIATMFVVLLIVSFTPATALWFRSLG